MGIAASATSITHVTETIQGFAVHLICSAPDALAPSPPPPTTGGAVLKGSRCMEPFLHVVFIMLLFTLTSLVGCLAQWLSLRSRFTCRACSCPLFFVVSTGTFSSTVIVVSDQAAAAYVLYGLRYSFRIAFDASLRSASSNMHSALDHPSVIDAHLAT